MSEPEHQQAPMDFQQRWRQRFEQFARKGTDEAGVAGWTSSGLAARVRNFSRHWDGRRYGETWLDAGCGAATYVRLMADSGADTIGVDYSLPSLLKAREWVPACHAWCAADVTCMPVRTGQLDGVLCFGVLQALAAPDAALAELARITRPGGVVWVDALNADCLVNRWVRIRRRMRGQGMHLRYDRANDLRGLLFRLGLRDIEIQWIVILPERLQWLQPLAESAFIRAVLGCWPWLARQLCHAFAIRARLPDHRADLA